MDQSSVLKISVPLGLLVTIYFGYRLLSGDMMTTTWIGFLAGLVGFVAGAVALMKQK